MRNKIFEAILYIMILAVIILIFVGACMADSASITPTAICVASAAVLLGIINLVAGWWIR